MQYNILVVIVLCLLVFMLTIQFQLNDLSTKIQDTIKRVDELVKERPKEKSNPTIQNMQF
jgi:cell division protein FtsL